MTTLDINWDEMPLGEMTDAALAALLGVSDSAVRAARIERGIAACIKHAPFMPARLRCANVLCQRPVPKGRRSFCSVDCKKRHHNDARYAKPGSRPFMQGIPFGSRRPRAVAHET